MSKDSETKTKKPVRLVTKVRLPGVAYDPVRLPDGSYGWVKYTRENGQEVVESVEVDGKVFEVAFPPLPEKSLVLPGGKGAVATAEALIERIFDLLSLVFFSETIEYVVFMALYILATWMYDEYEDVSYLNFSGLPGTGKTRGLFACAYLSYNAFIASGADSDSALRRSIDAIRGTLAMDEAQKEANDSSSEYHKILVLGNQAHGAIKRSVADPRTSKFSVESSVVFGPKILSGRGISADEAILSRVTTIPVPVLASEELSVGDLDKAWHDTALALRNDLLLYRQQRALGVVDRPHDLDWNHRAVSLGLSNREKQVYGWLFRECPPSALEYLEKVIVGSKRSLRRERAMQFEPQVLLATLECLRSGKCNALFSDIAVKLEEWRHGRIDSRSIGKVLRNNGIEYGHTNTGAKVKATVEQLFTALEKLGVEVPAEELRG